MADYPPELREAFDGADDPPYTPKKSIREVVYFGGMGKTYYSTTTVSGHIRSLDRGRLTTDGVPCPVRITDEQLSAISPCRKSKFAFRLRLMKQLGTGLVIDAELLDFAEKSAINFLDAIAAIPKEELAKWVDGFEQEID